MPGYFLFQKRQNGIRRFEEFVEILNILVEL